jgi:hypothetical protein
VSGWLWLVAILLALCALHFVARWMESRGWIYWTRSSGHSDRAGNALLEIQQMIEPSKRHVLQVKPDKRAERDDSGEGPDPNSH